MLCTAITKSGKSCKNTAIDGSDYCYVHAKQAGIRNPGEKEEKKPKLEITDKERVVDMNATNEELLERRLIESVRHSVEIELKRRYSWIGIIAIFLTSGMMYSVFTSVLDEHRVRLQKSIELEVYFQKKFDKAVDEIYDARRSIINKEKDFAQLSQEITKEVQSLKTIADEHNDMLSKHSLTQKNIDQNFNEQIAQIMNLVSILKQMTKESHNKVNLEKIKMSLKKSSRSHDHHH